jgi:hypothetical protein
MGEVFAGLAALVSVVAVVFAWRTVVLMRRAQAEAEQTRRLASLERLGLALIEMAAQLKRGFRADARLTPARARLLWVTSNTEVTDEVRRVVVTPIEARNHTNSPNAPNRPLKHCSRGLRIIWRSRHVRTRWRMAIRAAASSHPQRAMSQRRARTVRVHLCLR